MMKKIKIVLDNEDMKAEERLRPTLVIISSISDKIYIYTNSKSNECRKLIKMIMEIQRAKR